MYGARDGFFLKEELWNFTFGVIEAGFIWGLYNMNFGVRLIVKGYNDKLDTLYGIILNRIANFKEDEERFAGVLGLLKDLSGTLIARSRIGTPRTGHGAS